MVLNKPTYAARVWTVTPLGPGLRRVTLEFSDGAPSASERHPAGHCRLVFPGDEARPRVFTYSRWHPDGAVDIDFALHGGNGPAARWIAGAQPGAILGLRPGGPPKLSHVPRQGRIVMVADATGLPVVRALLEAHQCEVTILLHIATTVSGRHVPAQAQRFANEDTLSAACCGVNLTPQDTLFVACEAGLMRRLRRHALDVRGLPRAQVLTSGYWKRGHSSETVNRLKRAPEWFGDTRTGGDRVAFGRYRFEEVLQVALDGALGADEAIIENLSDRSRDAHKWGQDDDGK